MSPTSCVPSCHQSTHPIVTQIGDRQFWVTTDDQFPLTISCSEDKPTILTETTLGATTISLPCNCRILYGASVLVSDRLVCDHHNISEVTVQKVVPIQWTRRPIPVFADILKAPILLQRSEITTDSEDEVPVTDTHPGIPRWAEELLAAIGGAIAAALLAFATALIRRLVTRPRDSYLTPRRRRPSSRPTITVLTPTTAPPSHPPPTVALPLPPPPTPPPPPPPTTQEVGQTRRPGAPHRPRTVQGRPRKPFPASARPRSAAEIFGRDAMVPRQLVRNTHYDNSAYIDELD
ncbi:hypothetical protein ONE63_008173 [Megalurothrips usitatus]|uniref:Uncharacterized protein n=1 Tax=Megalurothrips usitatus TaxID=439358 RepID=A0AAV7XLB5_9NEOP|nr:hypothetical protein ONE63_008173 [Megalurothrips usitatus]